MNTPESKPTRTVYLDKDETIPETLQTALTGAMREIAMRHGVSEKDAKKFVRAEMKRDSIGQFIIKAYCMDFGYRYLPGFEDAEDKYFKAYSRYLGDKTNTYPGVVTTSTSFSVILSNGELGPLVEHLNDGFIRKVAPDLCIDFDKIMDEAEKNRDLPEPEDDRTRGRGKSGGGYSR